MIIIGAILFVVLEILLEVNLISLDVKDSYKEDNSMGDNHTGWEWEHREIAIIVIVLSFFSWYIISAVVIILCALVLLGKENVKIEIRGVIDSFINRRKELRFNLNIFKLSRILKLTNSSDPETKKLGVESLYNFMKWDKKELN